MVKPTAVFKRLIITNIEYEWWFAQDTSEIPTNKISDWWIPQINPTEQWVKNKQPLSARNAVQSGFIQLNQWKGQKSTMQNMSGLIHVQWFFITHLVIVP